MLTQKLYNYLLKTNYSFDDINVHSHSTCNDRKEIFQIKTKTMNRRGPTLSTNTTLMIEGGMVILVVTIVGLVFYYSHRNFKKRTNIHRRRWMESDVNIEVYSDGQVHEANMSPDENSPDSDQNDSPPPYELVVKQPKQSSRISTRNIVKTRQENDPHTPDTNLGKPNSGDEDMELHNCYLSENISSEPLITTSKENCNAVKNSESSLLIRHENTQPTSLINSRGACFIRDVDVAILQDEINLEIRDEAQTPQSVRKEIELTNKTLSQIMSPLMDISGLPSYDTAIKIHGCANI